MKKPPKMMKAKYLDGPLEGVVTEVPKGTEKITVGPRPNPFWTYTYAGKDGGVTLFAKRPPSRRLWFFIMYYIRKFGRHPAFEYSMAKSKPVRGRRVARGRGAAKRAAKKAA